jgi:hypothetical protein
VKRHGKAHNKKLITERYVPQGGGIEPHMGVSSRVLVKDSFPPFFLFPDCLVCAFFGHFFGNLSGQGFLRL